MFMPYMVNPHFLVVVVTKQERLELLKTPMVIDQETGKVMKLGFRDATKEEIEKYHEDYARDQAELEQKDYKMRMRNAGIVLAPIAPPPAPPAPKKVKQVASSD